MVSTAAAGFSGAALVASSANAAAATNAAAAAGSTASAGVAASVSAAQRASSFKTPAALMEALVKLRGSTDDRIAFWWMQGPRYGVVGTTVTPLFDNLVASFHRFVKQPDGNYKVTVVELSYYVDLATGELLKTWRNPITGAMNEVEYIVFGPVTATLTPAGITPPEVTPGAELRVKPTVGLVAEHGGQVWIQEDVAATIVPKVAGRTLYQGNDLATYQGSVADLIDPKRTSAPSTIHYQSVTDWRTWMKMGDIKGTLMARSVGAKVWSVDDLPANFLKIARKLNPQILADPMAALNAAQPDASFQR